MELCLSMSLRREIVDTSGWLTSLETVQAASVSSLHPVILTLPSQLRAGLPGSETGSVQYSPQSCQYPTPHRDCCVLLSFSLSECAETFPPCSGASLSFPKITVTAAPREAQPCPYEWRQISPSLEPDVALTPVTFPFYIHELDAGRISFTDESLRDGMEERE